MYTETLYLSAMIVNVLELAFKSCDSFKCVQTFLIDVHVFINMFGCCVMIFKLFCGYITVDGPRVALLYVVSIKLSFYVCIFSFCIVFASGADR